MAFEGIDASGPEPAEWSQPIVDFLKGFRFQPVETALCVHRGFHEAAVAQYTQMLGHCWLRHSKLTLDLANRLFRCDQEAQYRPAVGLGDDVEDRVHDLDIPNIVYACQGI